MRPAPPARFWGVFGAAYRFVLWQAPQLFLSFWVGGTLFLWLVVSMNNELDKRFRDPNDSELLELFLIFVFVLSVFLLWGVISVVVQAQMAYRYQPREECSSFLEFLQKAPRFYFFIPLVSFFLTLFASVFALVPGLLIQIPLSYWLQMSLSGNKSWKLEARQAYRLFRQSGLRQGFYLFWSVLQSVVLVGGMFLYEKYRPKNPNDIFDAGLVGRIYEAFPIENYTGVSAFSMSIFITLITLSAFFVFSVIFLNAVTALESLRVLNNETPEKADEINEIGAHLD